MPIFPKNKDSRIQFHKSTLIIICQHEGYSRKRLCTPIGYLRFLSYVLLTICESVPKYIIIINIKYYVTTFWTVTWLSPFSNDIFIYIYMCVCTTNSSWWLIDWLVFKIGVKHQSINQVDEILSYKKNKDYLYLNTTYHYSN